MNDGFIAIIFARAQVISGDTVVSRVSSLYVDWDATVYLYIVSLQNF